MTVANAPQIRAIAFDCFGTLLRITAPTQPWRALLIAAREQSAVKLLDPRREPIPTLCAFAAASGVEFRPEWQRQLDVELSSIALIPGAKELLQRLRADGYRLALASNLARPYVKPVRDLLLDLVDECCFSCEIRAVKPEPEFFRVLSAKLALPPSEILMVGDSLTSDVGGAHATGMHALHLVLDATQLNPGQISKLEAVTDWLKPPYQKEYDL